MKVEDNARQTGGKEEKKGERMREGEHGGREREEIRKE